MGLQQYRRKRRFGLTPEPRGKQTRRAPGRCYVIQKHAATRLHYDLRLELDGVLLSWAIPKGPSLDPSVRSLAIQVEDHPLEYRHFEGEIPAGHYGAGQVIVWDSGTWRPIGDPHEALKTGRLKFELRGSKLKGVWNLIRLKRVADRKKSEWLLIKHSDEFAQPESEMSITREQPQSVLSGAEIMTKAGSPRERLSKRSAPDANGAARRQPASKHFPAVAQLPGAIRAAQPASMAPQLAQPAAAAPDGPQWIHEIKFDGYRLICILRNGRAKLLTRRGLDWTARFRHIARACEQLGVKNAILDGEVVALDERGRSDFQRLQNALRSDHSAELTFFVFDVPHFDAYDLTQCALIDRRNILATILSSRRGGNTVRFSDHVVGNGESVLRAACQIGLEGIVSKRADAKYHSRRDSSWQKIKCSAGQEFVIGGFTDAGGSRVGFGALLLGTYDSNGALHYRGRVGTGFNDHDLMTLGEALRSIEIDEPPFHNPPKVTRMHWVRPMLVAQVHFTEFTRDGRVRHPSFQGLREDKPPREVIREDQPMPQLKRRAPQRKTEPVGPRPVPSDNGRKPNRNGPASRATPQSKGADSKVAGVRITNPQRVVFPQAGLTKFDLAEYFAHAAEHMLPHVAHRPLMIVRCPAGADGTCFYQKHRNATLAKFPAVPIAEKSKMRDYVYIRHAEDIVRLAQFGVIELHTWACRVDRVEAPDRVIFDLDPAADVEWTRVRDAAIMLRELLAQGDLKSFVKLSGGKGLHIVAPIDRRAGWDAVESFARALAMSIAQYQPNEFVATMSKAKRTGKIFIDYLRTQRGATCVAPWSPRARPSAAVSLPVDWNELNRIAAGDQFDIPAALQRLKLPDPWAEMPSIRQRLPRLPPTMG
ncbi:MAG: DNA ligase D [Phycisphaerales bacterium]|nr:DNA ligase D [Phycisphaerales bacterium]